LAKKPVVDPKVSASGSDDARLKFIRDRAERAKTFDDHNLDEAATDLEFRAGLNQWPKTEREQRQAEGRPALTENRIPQFVRQVTGDIRQMKPALKAYGVDDKGDAKRAELVTDLLRYIENRSDATDAYFRAVDSQVACGIGHWRIVTEYCDDEGQAQDILIQSVDDQINVLWDPDASKPNREDAAYCFVPVDMTLAVFKERYPDASAANFDSLDRYRSTLGDNYAQFWSTGETIRVAEYWDRKETKAKDGRKTVKVYRSVVSGSEILEPATEWPGKYIPIVPVIGEEVRISGKTYRHGVIRFLREPQQRYNYFLTAETEVIALQPKAPFMATEKQIGDRSDMWQRANHANQPVLIYDADPQAPGAPQRVPPPVSSQGFQNAIAQAAEGMKAVTGIYDAALGAKSNETSGKAILARQREGDVGTYVYVDNFLRALKHTGRIILDLLPTFYDTARTLRIIGEDGAINEVKINQPAGVAEMNDEGQPVGEMKPETVIGGKYDIFVQAGPSYTTKRDEAKEGMTAFMQANPAATPLIADLYAAAMDWPMADKISERLKEMLPPQIKAKEEQEAGEQNGQPVEQQVPPPEVIAQQAQQELIQSIEGQLKQAELATKAAQARKAEADAMKAEAELQMMMQPPAPAPMPMEAPQPDPMEAIRLKAMEKRALTEVDLEAEMYRRKMERDTGQVVEMGMGEDAAEPAQPMGPTPVELLAQAIMQQGQAFQAGMSEIGAAMQALAQAQMAPTEVIRDQTGKAVGARKVMN
jgi:hypothetical protein